MKTLVLSAALTLSTAALPVFAQDAAEPAFGTIEYGVIEYGTLPPENTQSYGVDLGPGEKIVGTYPLPSPSLTPMPVQTAPTGIIYKTIPYTPPADIDRVTGLPRNTPGWTGDAARPAGIGCFPQGACSHLNR